MVPCKIVMIVYVSRVCLKPVEEAAPDLPSGKRRSIAMPQCTQQAEMLGLRSKAHRASSEKNSEWP
jgi:hypothetical protein